jgi:hypothetical protein
MRDSCAPAARKHVKVTRIIEGWRDKWGWSDIDCARALAPALGESSVGAVKVKAPRQAKDSVGVSLDMQALFEALKVREGEADVPPTPLPTRCSGDLPVLRALDVLRKRGQRCPRVRFARTNKLSQTSNPV